MKKKLAILTAVFVLITSLAGCNNNKLSKQNEDSENGIIKIDWLSQNDSPVDNNSPVVARINEMYGVKLNFIYLDRNKETELLNIRIASGEIPDVLRVQSDTRYRDLINQGVINEIPENDIKTIAPTLYQVTKENGGDDIWDVAKEGGKLYGLPLLGYNGKYHYVPLWRDDWLRKVGIDKLPETVDEAEAALYKFTKNDPDGNGVNDTYGLSINGIKAILNAYGAHPLNYYWMKYNGAIEMSAVIPEMKEALTRIHKWYKDGVVDPEFITGENNGQHFATAATFNSGRIGFSMPGMPYHVNPPFEENGAGASGNYKTFKEIQGKDASFAYAKPLIGPAGKQGAEHWGVFSGGYALVGRNVKPGSEKMKKILEIHESQNSDFDAYIYCLFGRKDQDYTLEDGVYNKLIEPKERQALGLGATGIQMIANNFKMQEETMLPQQIKFYEDYGTISDIDHYRQEVWGSLPSDNLYLSSIQQDIEENYYAFISGARSLDEFEKWTQELNAAGLEQLRKEANEWYTERYGSIN